MGLAAQPSLDVFNVTPGQFGKDVAGGVINFGVGIMGMVAQGLAQGNPVSSYQISRAQNAVSSKINSAIGANENSLGYWMGSTYSAAIAGGIFAAELESVTASAQTNQTLPFLGTEPKLWTPLNGPGPLGKDVASTFRSSTYTEHILKEDVILYRNYGGKASNIGPYWTRVKPNGVLQSQLDSAILPEWGNTFEGVEMIKVPKGTKIYEGIVGPQNGIKEPFVNFIGGGNQVFIPRVNPNWIIK